LTGARPAIDQSPDRGLRIASILRALHGRDFVGRGWQARQQFFTLRTAANAESD